MRAPARRASVLLGVLCIITLLSSALGNDVGFYTRGSFGQADKQGERASYDAFVADVHDFLG